MTQREILDLIRIELAQQSNRLGRDAPHVDAANPAEAVLAGEFDLLRVARRLRDGHSMGRIVSPAATTAPAPPVEHQHFSEIYAAMQAAARS